jgi:hypothetical protein
MMFTRSQVHARIQLLQVSIGYRENGRPYKIRRGSLQSHLHHDDRMPPVTLRCGSIIGKREEFGLNRSNANRIHSATLKVVKVYKDGIVVKVCNGVQNLPHCRRKNKRLTQVLHKKKHHMLYVRDSIVLFNGPNEIFAFSVAPNFMA